MLVIATSEDAVERLSIETVNAMARDDFAAVFGNVFEHSPWVAEDAWARRPFADVEVLHRAMVAAMRAAGRERQRALVKAHPDLAGKAAMGGDPTVESRAEQASAGLDRCTPEEFARLQSLNRVYGEKFGFPFVMAVRRRGRQNILAAMTERLANTAQAEFGRALGEIETIARLRLTDLVEG